MANETENHIYVTSSYPDETYIKDGMSINPITVNGASITVIPGDYVKVKNYQGDDSAVIDLINEYPSSYDILYVYTTNNKWSYAGTSYNYIGGMATVGLNCYNGSGWNRHYLTSIDAHLTYEQVIGNTENTIVSIGGIYTGWPDVYINDYNPNYHEYGVEVTDQGTYDRSVSSPLTTQAQVGDCAEIECWVEASEGYYGVANIVYQYPGVWVNATDYPDLTVVIPTTDVPKHVQLKWTDPPDITTWEPTPCSWEGTVIVRKENSPPLSRWDGVKVVRSTTRNEYKSTPYKDEDIEDGKVYYYAFMPYYTKVDDPNHPIRYYTFTKTIRVETGVISYAPEIIEITMDQDVATITYAIVRPASGAYESAKLYGKKNSVPACDDTDDIVEDVSQSDTSITVADIVGTYYFCIQVSSGTDTLTSNIMSSVGEGPEPDPEFLPQLSTMNDIAAYKFAWANIPEYYYARLTLQYQYPVKNYSYSTHVYSSTLMDTFSSNFEDSGKRISYMRTYNPLTLIVTKNSNNNYTGRIDFPAGSTASIHNIYNPKNHNASWVSIGVSSVESGAVNYWNFGNTGDGDTTVAYVTYTGTLTQVMNWYSDRFRNISVYVDGKCWALIGRETS